MVLPNGYVSPASDVHSLGRTFLRLFWPADQTSPLYEACPADYDAYRYDAATRGSADPLENAVAILTAHMIAEQPENRPQSMSDVLERLHAIEQGTVGSTEHGTIAPAKTSFISWITELITRYLLIRR
jgi:hypothetical protein